MKHAFITTVDRVNTWLMGTLVILFAIVSCITFAQVVARYVFQAPFVWSEEVIRYGIICMVFLGAGLAVRRGAMIAIEILLFAVPGRLGRALRLLALIISAVIWLMLGWLSIRIQADLEGIRAGVMEIPIRYLYLAMPVGCSWALVNTVVLMVEWFDRSSVREQLP